MSRYSSSRTSSHSHPPPQRDIRQENQDVETLHQCFPSYDRAALRSILQAERFNFQAAYNAISRMEQTTVVKITPERVLGFVRAIFEELPAALIQNILQKWKWSVEGALDELLAAEEQRCQRVEEERRRREEERFQREMAELRQRQQQQAELERRAAFNNFQAMFPRLSHEIISYEFQRQPYNPQAIYNALLAREQERIQQEQYAQQMREQQYRAAEAQRKAEEERRLQQGVDKVVQQGWEQLLKANDWDDVAKMVGGYSATEQQRDKERKEREAMVHAAHETFPHLTEEEITKIFEAHNWNKEKAVAEMEAKSYSKVFSRLAEMFPILSAQEIDAVLRQYYPNDAAAIQALNPIAKGKEQGQLHMTALAKAEQALEEALKAQSDYEAQVARIEEQRKIRAAEIARMPDSSEKSMLQTLEEMKRQKEDVVIRETRQRLQAEVDKRRKQLEEERQKLDQMKAEAVVQAPPPPPPEAIGLEARAKAFEEKVRRKQSLHQQQEEEEQLARQSLIAENMKNKLGAQRFAQLQEAIRRAPGGATKNFHGMQDRPEFYEGRREEHVLAEKMGALNVAGSAAKPAPVASTPSQPSLTTSTPTPSYPTPATPTNTPVAATPTHTQKAPAPTPTYSAYPAQTPTATTSTAKTAASTPSATAYAYYPPQATTPTAPGPTYTQPTATSASSTAPGYQGFPQTYAYQPNYATPTSGTTGSIPPYTGTASTTYIPTYAAYPGAAPTGPGQQQQQPTYYYYYPTTAGGPAPVQYVYMNPGAGPQQATYQYQGYPPQQGGSAGGTGKRS